MRIWLVSLLALVSSAAQAQDYCSSVLAYAARDYSQEARENSIAKSAYDEYCSGADMKSSSNTNVGLDAVIEEIPVKFNLGNGNSSDRMSRFCKNFHDEFQSHNELYQSSSLVSPASVKAWSDCVSLYGAGISFNPTVNALQVIVSVRKISPDTVFIHGVKFDRAAMDCSATSDNSHDGTVPASLNTNKTLNSGDEWQVSCDRIKINGALQETFLSVLTTKGAFSLRVPPDAIIDPQTAAELNARLAQLAATVTNDESADGARITTLEARNPHLTEGSTVNLGWKGRDTVIACPAGQFLTQFDAGSRNADFNIGCASLKVEQ